jgi:hypothetical protein
VCSVPGCAGPGAWNPTEGLDESTGPAGSADRPAAIITESPVDRDELWPLLAELAGAEAVRELAIDRAVAAELLSRGLVLDEALIEAERNLLAQTLGVQADESEELSRLLVQQRRLGPERLGRLLRRNASLRLLVGEGGPLEPAAVRIAYQIRHGERRVVRVSAFARATDAAAAADRIRSRAPEVGLSAAFAEAAVELSQDPTSSFGGLLGEVSVLDPGLPAALRQAVERATPGELGPMVALERGFGLVLVERAVPADSVDFESVRGEIETQMRARRQRLEMEALADQLLTRAGVTVLEPSLRWSWELPPG